MGDISFKLNGQRLTAKPGETIIEVADRHGIYIPRFCYHKDLSVAANCRMCLVDVKQSHKPLPACATPISQDMEVDTRSVKTKETQESIMRFLLVNHPLDCPICDQGGECDLQDLALTYGESKGATPVEKRSVVDEDLGPLVQTHMTRCIQCTRCVRYGQEVAGFTELGQIGRGSDIAIGTFLKSGMHSEVSGNVIELCPVGALTDKTYRFQGRSWGYKRHPSIAPHDCIGSHVYVHTHQEAIDNHQLMRIVPKHHAALNHIWLSDRDRFSYRGLNEDRLDSPMVKRNGVWSVASWDEALSYVVEQMATCVAKGFFSGPQTTFEEAYDLQHLARYNNAKSLDSLIRWADHRDLRCYQTAPLSNGDMTSLSSYKDILIIGGHIPQDQPIMSIFLRAAVAKGSQVTALRATSQPLPFDLAGDMCMRPSEWVSTIQKWTQQGGPLKRNSQTLILVANDVFYHPEGARIREAIYAYSEQLLAKVWMLTDGPNTYGQWLAGMVPHQGPGFKPLVKTLSGLCDAKELDFVWLHGIEMTDTLNQKHLQDTLKQAVTVVAVHPYKDESLLKYCDVLLPSVPFTEMSGTYINMFGMPQKFMPCVKPYAQALPGQRIYELMRVKASDHTHSVDHRDSLLSHIQDTAYNRHAFPDITNDRLYRYTMTGINGQVRRSRELVASDKSNCAGVFYYDSGVVA